MLDPMVMKPNMNPDALKLINEPPMSIPLVLSNFVSAFLPAYIFEKWDGIRTFMSGLQGGVIVWFMIALAFQLMFLAFLKLSNNYIPAIADIGGSIVMGAIGGGVIGQVLGMMNKGSSSE